MQNETGAIKRLRQTLTTGNLWLYVLSLVSKRKTHAYVLRDEIEKTFKWKPGLILSYVVMYKLENEGLITSKFEGRRKYYSITSKGKEALKNGKELLNSLSKNL